jgi:hypothetical protein
MGFSTDFVAVLSALRQFRCLAQSAWGKVSNVPESRYR